MSDEVIAAASSTPTGSTGTDSTATGAPPASAAASTPAVVGDQSGTTAPAATAPTGTPPAPAATGTTEATKQPATPAEVVYDLKLPAGALLTKDVLPQLAAVAKTLSLSPEQAQKFVDHQNTLVAQATKDQEAAWKKTTTDWEAEIKADPHIGGANLDVSKRDFDTAMSKSDKGFRELLEKSGYVNHPSVRRELSRMGKLMREDGFTGSGASGPTESRDEALRRSYPTM